MQASSKGTARLSLDVTEAHFTLFLCFFVLGVTGELSTLRQLMKVPNEPGVSPNNGLGNTGNIDKGHKDIAAAAVAAVYGGKYLECNLKIDSSANLPSDHVLIALDQMRQAMKSEEWGWDHAFHTEDFRTGTLILTGIAGKGSGGHVDWSQAQNIAFSFTQASSVTVILR